MEVMIGKFARRWRRWLTIVLTTAVLPVFSATGDNDAQRVSQIKAAIVLNVARFVTWPSDQGLGRDQMRLCFYRVNILSGAEHTITQNPVAGHAVDTRTIQGIDPADQCDVVLIPGSQVQRFVGESTITGDRPFLTIADLTAADKVNRAYRGVHVNLVRRGNGVGLEINLDDVDRAGLRMSSKLLKLARIVGGDAE